MSCRTACYGRRRLAREAPSDVVARAYGGHSALFGKTSLIPSPFDPRLILRIAPAVARAAMESGVARRPIADFNAYADQLNRFVYRSGFIMRPLFAAARRAMKRVIYSEGEDERVLRAAQVVREERIALPVLIGRPEVIRNASSASASRFGRAPISKSSIRTTIRATATMSRPIWRWRSARA